VFIDSKADMDDRIQDWNYRATKMAIKSAVLREPKAADVLKHYKEAQHPFAAKTPEAKNRRSEDQAAALAIAQMKERSLQIHQSEITMDTERAIREVKAGKSVKV
jgi:5,6,7,8-tetrahydromethanopterin hydro-lyase